MMKNQSFFDFAVLDSFSSQNQNSFL